MLGMRRTGNFGSPLRTYLTLSLLRAKDELLFVPRPTLWEQRMSLAPHDRKRYPLCRTTPTPPFSLRNPLPFYYPIAFHVNSLFPFEYQCFCLASRATSLQGPLFSSCLYLMPPCLDVSNSLPPNYLFIKHILSRWAFSWFFVVGSFVLVGWGLCSFFVVVVVGGGLGMAGPPPLSFRLSLYGLCESTLSEVPKYATLPTRAQTVLQTLRHRNICYFRT